MKITDIKINGLRQPMGFRFEPVCVSWLAEEAAGREQRDVQVVISADREGRQALACARGAELTCAGVVLTPRLEPRTRYYAHVTVEDETGDSVRGSTFFETGKLDEGWAARWVGPAEEDRFHPVLTKRFSARGTEQGRLYISGLGLYEAYLNGKKVGEDLLAPFFSDYAHEIQYQSYDVTGLLAGENVLEIYLGNGWYKGRYGIQGQTAYYGDRFAAIAELYLDGALAVKTDGGWIYRGSDVADSGIYDGEELDRLLWQGRDNPERPVCPVEVAAPLVERYSPPVTAAEALPVREVIRTPRGETVLDFGQNHAGLLQIHVRQPAGTTLVFECGEILQQGCFYRDNYRAAKARFVYRSDGREETVRQHFTYYGFRYVRVTGWVGELDPADFYALVVCSRLERTGFVETGHEKLNRLYENALWGQKSNFIDMPTDCPQRDERLGWTGDAQVFAPTACYNMDTRAFYAKFLHDLREEQLRYGKGGVPSYLPSMGDFSACAVWGDAAALLPRTLERFYNDPVLLERFYPLVRDWVEYVKGQSRENLYDTGFGFGDWLAQDGLTPQSFKGGTDDVYIASVYACESARILSEMAGRLGREDDRERYARLSGDIRQAVLDRYFTKAGRLSVDTQAAYVIALKFGVYVDRAVLLEQFRRRLQYDHFKIRCGFVGAPLLCTVLAEQGMTGDAYDLLLSEEFPGWLYAVDLGATTIWERWNSLLPDGTCSGTGMNSFNHYSYGSVMEFVYAYAAGIRPGADGFGRAILAPEPDVRLRYVNASYRSAAGRYVCNWRIREDGVFQMHIEVPFHCTATVTLPRSGRAPFQVTAGRYDYEYTPTEDFRAVYGWHTRLGQLRGDDEAAAVLAECAPPLAGIPAGGDSEMLLKDFDELQHAFFLGMTPERAERTVARLQRLLRW